jgi:hypothetical protein
MDVLAIILACSLHPDDTFVRTLVDVQSGGNVYFVGDLATLKTNDALASPAAALRFAEELRRHGGKPAVGLLGIPLAWAGRYGRAPIELFDGCTNVAVATAAFAEYQERCAPARPRAAPGRSPAGHAHRRRRYIAPTAQRSCILSRFAHELGLASTPSAIFRRLVPGAGAPSNETLDPPPQRSLVFVDGEEGQRRDSASRPHASIFLDAPAMTSETH